MSVFPNPLSPDLNQYVSIRPVQRGDLSHSRQDVRNTEYGRYLGDHVEFQPLWTGNIHRVDPQQSRILVHQMKIHHHRKPGGSHSCLEELKESKHIHPVGPGGSPSFQLPAAPGCGRVGQE